MVFSRTQPNTRKYFSKLKIIYCFATKLVEILKNKLTKTKSIDQINIYIYIYIASFGVLALIKLALTLSLSTTNVGRAFSVNIYCIHWCTCSCKVGIDSIIINYKCGKSFFFVMNIVRNPLIQSEIIGFCIYNFNIDVYLVYEIMNIYSTCPYFYFIF